MKKRICTKCKVKEPINKTKSYCKDCHNEYQKKYYKEHPKSIRDSSDRRRKKIRELIIKTKDVPCSDCLKKYPYYVMDLDHVKGEKKFNLASAGNRLVSLDKIKEEIGKCEIVCANCHRIRTFKRGSMI